VLLIAGSAEPDGYAHVVGNRGAPLGEADLEWLVRQHLPALLRT
jgi:hypothetical protein